MELAFPENTPKAIGKVLRETISEIQSATQSNLIGVYLCGSLAMGCYNPRSSDVDIMMVTKQRLSKEERKSIIRCLKETYSKERRIELSVVCENAIRNPQYPMMVDLQFEDWGGICENRRDKEILSNLYTTKERGFCVWGAPIRDLFSEVPARYHLVSVIEDIQQRRRHLHEKPENIGYDITVYWILGSCRVLAFIREERVLSKLEGGHWGIANLPREYHNLIRNALSRYQGKERTGHEWNREELETFADYMTAVILRESKLKTI